MRVALLNYAYDQHLASPEALLARYETLTGWAEGLSAAGAQVTVWQRFHHDARLVRAEAAYHFVADGFSSSLRLWQIPWRLHREARCHQPDILHVNGFLFPLQAAFARHLTPSTAITVVQHHAEQPFIGWRARLQRWGLRRMDGFLFAARSLADPWLARGVIPAPERVFEVMEGSTHFQRESRAAARARTGLIGDPLFLWVGHLIDRKDPLTVLAGFELLLAQVPEARLYMIYGSEELLPQVRAMLARSPALQDAVRLLGQIPHASMAAYYNSADYFVLGSHYEGSGYALVEALACGVVPLVTDIPSFRMMTDGGRLGALWPVGQSEGLARAAVGLLQKARVPLAEGARAFFEERLSFPTIGRRATDIYRFLLSQKRNRS